MQYIGLTASALRSLFISVWSLRSSVTKWPRYSNWVTLLRFRVIGGTNSGFLPPTALKIKYSVCLNHELNRTSHILPTAFWVLSPSGSAASYQLRSWYWKSQNHSRNPEKKKKKKTGSAYRAGLCSYKILPNLTIPSDYDEKHTQSQCNSMNITMQIGNTVDILSYLPRGVNFIHLIKPKYLNCCASCFFVYSIE